MEICVVRGIWGNVNRDVDERVKSEVEIGFVKVVLRNLCLIERL